MAGDFVVFSCLKLHPSLDFPSLWSKGRVWKLVKNVQGV